MKKLNLFLVLVVSIFVFNIDAKAEQTELIYNNTISSSCNYYYTDYNYIKELGYDENLQRIYQFLLEEYNTNYSLDYPYYHVDIVVLDSFDCNSSSVPTNKIGLIRGFLNLFTEIPTSYGSSSYIVVDYDVSSTTYTTPLFGNSYYYQRLIEGGYYNPMAYFISNYDLVNNTVITYNVSGNSNFIINPGDIIKPYFSVDNAFQQDYSEINLNDYAYIALSLKNYNQEPFSTNVHVKGNYCLTPVYNYGMTERKDILTGSQVQRCSPYYDNYTPVRTYITELDLKNHAIYYLKAYDTSKDNSVKVDTSVFDITYITEDKANYPYVTIDGKTYPTIPYNDLTDTSTKSEDEGYNSGTSCAVGDFNCMTSSSTSSFSDLFDKPLEVLKSIWSSITSVFSLITYLISLLPSEMATFLYLGFTLAIVIGLIKIIL